ncbi:MAG: ADP-ribosylglycohydrolase family protein [Ruminococcaceae bacterium]|nr:ADP-ribosylglycohydrolase family protein [Oscillospiraceae bacterium]
MELKKNYANMGWWESYQRDLMTEYRQSVEEGLDIEEYKSLFEVAAKLPDNETKDRVADAIFNLVLNAKIKEGYKYNEPSDLEGIKALREKFKLPKKKLGKRELEKKIHGAWMGRAVGCLLGKPVECIWTDELHKLLKASDNYPMHRYINSTDITEEMTSTFRYNLRNKCWADTVSFMPYDDDTNYTVMGQKIIDWFGRGFTPNQVADIWLKLQPKESYCTAERIAYMNFLKGYRAPESALYKNPFREWIGAQIRGDYFGYINPGKPEEAARMAYNDACISHIKNGIYGEMLASAMIAAAAVCDTAEEIILAGLSQIPKTSRLYEDVMGVLDMYKAGKSVQECYDYIHTKWDEKDGHGWCHTISNAMIVAYAILYGENDFGKSVCLAVESAFDTDCNGATVGSIMGMKNGIDKIDEYWQKPLNNKIETTLIGVGTVKITDMVKRTMEHINKK